MAGDTLSVEVREDALGNRASVWLDRENQILRQEISGKVNRETSMWLAERSGALAQGLDDPERVRILIEAFEGGKADAYARKDFGKNLQRSEIEKVAFCNANALVRLVVRFVRIGTGSRNVRVFGSEREALKWLKA